MVGFATLLLALLLIYLLSKIFIQSLYESLLLLTHNHNRAAYIVAFIFLPGTFIHEMSHFLSALFLIVPVSELNLVPEITDKSIKMGSVKIGKTDLFSSSIIGIAPIISGLSIMLLIISFSIMKELYTNPYFVVFFLYCIFQITHTMFSSKRDIASFLELIVLIIIAIVLMVLFDITQPFMSAVIFLEKNHLFIEQLSYYLFIPIFMEIILIVFLRLLIRRRHFFSR